MLAINPNTEFLETERVYTDYYSLVALGGIAVIVLAIGPKVCGFKQDRGQWIFKSYKISTTRMRGVLGSRHLYALMSGALA
jgi:hypothetical protein